MEEEPRRVTVTVLGEEEERVWIHERDGIYEPAGIYDQVGIIFPHMFSSYFL